MLNFHGLPHGGVIFSLADAAFAAACNSYGQAAVTLNVNISFLAASRSARVSSRREQKSMLRPHRPLPADRYNRRRHSRCPVSRDGLSQETAADPRHGLGTSRIIPRFTRSLV